MPFAPGGTTDIVARVVAQKLSEVWKRQVVLDNRGGAGGSIGTELAAKAPPDGYTVLFGLQTTHAINPAVYKNLPFDPIKDFTPVTRVAFSPQRPWRRIRACRRTTCSRSFPSRKLRPAATATDRPGPGPRSTSRSRCSSAPRASILSTSRNKGNGAGQMTELLGGQVQAIIGGLVALSPHVKSGELCAIAMASMNRSPVLPDVPTMADWFCRGSTWSRGSGCSTRPARRPRSWTVFLDATRQVLNAPEVRQRIEEQGAEVAPSESRKEFTAFVAKEKTLWGKVVNEVMSEKPAASGGR